jgi:hypothetical protein
MMDCELCSHCGYAASVANPLNRWDWKPSDGTIWPDGVWLHVGCEGPWADASPQFQFGRLTVEALIEQKRREKGTA